ncbi:MAG: hypothetical protein B7X89_00175 [Sulfuricurvum sp. 17-40-25]|nr:MAG: hypothetical protein B7Y30_08040 [Campylobacterales bacterium 16-40-21]OZA04006.1 MAG: hypothetical protein B7X89_00175 [Sulfuricurvum sp. 17-40-25]
MNDKTITKIITKIHFNLLTFFLLLFLGGFFIFVALLEGFTISHLKLGDIKFERLYLKWDNRLAISVAVIDLNELHPDNEPITLKPLSKITNTIYWIEQWVSSIDIEAIRYQKNELSIHYKKGALGWLDVHVGNEHLTGSFNLSPEVLAVSLSSKADSVASINGFLHLYLQKQKLNASAHLTLPNSPTLMLSAIGDQEKLYLDVKADHSFSNLDALVDFFDIDATTRPWITEYAKARAFTLLECHGSFLYNKPQKLLQSIFIRATVDNAQYTFAPTIAPIIAEKVDLIFTHGILYIRPENGHFYTMPTQQSNLLIDFNPVHILLKAHIKTNQAQLNDSILNLLRYYEITVPIRQNKGLCNVDLNLTVDLNNFKTTATGKFTPGKSELQLENFIFQTMGGIVTLDTTKVSFSGFDARYKNILHAKVKGFYHADIEKGNVQIIPYSCTPTGDATSIALSPLPLNVKAIYHINPRIDRLQILPTQWKIFNEIVKVEGFTIPYDFNNTSATIPKLRFYIPNKVQGSLEGNLSSNEWLLQFGLTKFNLKDLLLRNGSYAFTLKSDTNTVNITSKLPSSWQLNGQDFSLSPLKINITENKLLFDNIKVKVDTIIQGALSGEYLWKLNKGLLTLNDTKPLNPYISGYIKLNKTEKFSFNTLEGQLELHSQSMGVDFSTMNQGWKITVPDISLLSHNSPILRQYQIKNGNANLYYNPTQRIYTFHGVIDYPYHLMTVNDESLSRYQFNGSYQNGKSSINVNNHLRIEYADDINIHAMNMGINAPELARWLDMPSTHTESNKSSADKTIHLSASNVYLYIMKNRKVMADTLTATLSQGDLKARLAYAHGSADLMMKDGVYYVEGSRFNDTFMENLFALSDFDGGEMSFKLSGKADDFEGIMRIENTTLKEYKLLNNVLSFINTIPALATFSLPNYNSKGLPLKEAYSHYTFKNHQFIVDNFTLNSPELKMVGEGKVNYKEDSIKGTLTLKSDLGSQIGRIPMVGYILFGDDRSISTTLNIKGKLSDPVVETGVLKEIITAPFNILKRTITYPFLWMMDDDKKKEK